MKLVGRRTYAACLTVIALAAAQRFLKLAVPQEIWFALFGLVVMALRAAIEEKGRFQ